MNKLSGIAKDAQFALNYFSLPVRAVGHADPHSKGGITFATDTNPHTTLGKKCRRRWMNSELPNRCLENMISKICRMICRNTGDCDIRILSGKVFS